MKFKNALCTDVKYGEFPDLLFGKSDDDLVYFDATHYILQKGDVRKHNIKSFEIGFMHWRNAVRDAYSIPAEDMFVTDEATGHLLIEESLALLFVVYIDPEFGVYMLERISEMLLRGITLSDTRLLMLASERLSKDQLFNLNDE
ncbi:hypothetical protein [Bacteroides sp.]|uniref:hypothetical protein n=1 Tax=Bacteroides sp. TaxID=29523 RepID=UPI002A8105EA|nr:hypothetical protein [Bacteroides sp.]